MRYKYVITRLIVNVYYINNIYQEALTEIKRMVGLGTVVLR